MHPELINQNHLPSSIYLLVFHLCRSLFHHQHQKLSHTCQSDRDCWSFPHCSVAHTLCFSLLVQAWTTKHYMFRLNLKTNDFPFRIVNSQFPLYNGSPGNHGSCNQHHGVDICFDEFASGRVESLGAYHLQKPSGWKFQA